MATTLDFTLDTQDDMFQPMTPVDSKRKRNEMKTPPDQIENTTNQVTIVLNPRRSIVQITSPEAKKLRNLTQPIDNLDPDIKNRDPIALDPSTTTSTTCQAETEEGLVNNDTLIDESQMEVSTESSVLIDTQASPVNTQPISGEAGAVPEVVTPRPSHARRRSYSDPSVQLINQLGSNPVNTKDIETSLLPILLDIQTRMHKIETSNISSISAFQKLTNE